MHNFKSRVIRRASLPVAVIIGTIAVAGFWGEVSFPAQLVCVLVPGILLGRFLGAMGVERGMHAGVGAVVASVHLWSILSASCAGRVNQCG